MALKPQNDREMKGLEGSNPPFSAIESFSVYDSARNDRNTRLRGRFRIACGTGERSKPRFRPICGSFYPQQSESGPRRKSEGQLSWLEEQKKA
jgi:hypothetical protein